jgi:hypothetical protein
MRKTFVWALMAIMAVAGSAFAGNPGEIVANATFLTGSPATTNNDDSCDISVAPAATLLLPYFEVNPTAGGENTTFTVTNVSQLPQIAHVTIWTDYSFPVLDFNIFLTGYDVQSISLYDIIYRNQIAPPGTTSDSDTGRRSADNDGNALLDISNCDVLAVVVPDELAADLRSALTLGRTVGCGTARIGGVHTNAIGYVTIDVAESCSTALPTDPGYFTTEVLYDNVLIGDYAQIDASQNFAQGNPMVHIRAVPEGGAPGAGVTNFDRTFYSRYQAGGTADRRQPLPSTFAARWISGSSADFQTSLKIWREGRTGATAGCAVTANSAIPVVELVRFDESENPTTFTPGRIISPLPTVPLSRPETSRTPVTDPFFPPNSTSDVGGWMYLNLDDSANANAPGAMATQNWVIVSMRAQGIYSVDFDAAWLGNGCSPAVGVTGEDFGFGTAIGPAANVTPDL